MNDETKINIASMPGELAEAGRVVMEKLIAEQREQERQERRASRYQFQAWYVKAYRWMRYMPIAFGRGLVAVARALFASEESLHRNELGRRDAIELAWNLTIADAHIKMNWLYDLEEVMEVAE